MDLGLSVRIGNIQVEFEGSNEIFLKNIEPVAKDLIAFGKQKFSMTSPNADSSSVPVKSTGQVPSMTVKSIAAKLGGNSGSELLYAAIASLSAVKKKETFTRQEANDEMKLAVGYYKPSYTSNLSNYLDTLAKQGTIIETSKDIFAVKDSERTTMEQRLAQ